MTTQPMLQISAGTSYFTSIEPPQAITSGAIKALVKNKLNFCFFVVSLP